MIIWFYKINRKRELQMPKNMDELIELGLGTFIDAAVDMELSDDEIYLKDMADLEEIKEKLDKTLDKEQKRLMEDYAACLFSVNAHVSHIAYLTGVKNTMLLLQRQPSANWEQLPV